MAIGISRDWVIADSSSAIRVANGVVGDLSNAGELFSVFHLMIP